jgi:hypothetical protein
MKFDLISYKNFWYYVKKWLSLVVTSDNIPVIDSEQYFVKERSKLIFIVVFQLILLFLLPH